MKKLYFSGNQMSDKALRPGTVLNNRYRIKGILGRGGMSVVYLALDSSFENARCAVKEMFDSLIDPVIRAAAYQSFKREANLLRDLNELKCPHIPQIYDSFEYRGRHYMVYELIPGQDLARHLQKRACPLSPQEVVDWVIQLTDVLTILHQRNPPIIFRDLKPSNVMLKPNGQIVLIDFGIAKNFESKKGTMIGTQGYAPPEQYQGIANALVDIYALGATMHHLLTNTDPQDFAPFSFHQRPIQQYNPAVSNELAAIVMRALSYKAQDRWQSMLELRQVLKGGQLSPSPSDDKREDGDSEQIDDPTEQESQVENWHRTIEPSGSPSTELQITPLWTFTAEDEIRSTPCLTKDSVVIGSYDTNLYCLDRATGHLRWKFATQGGIATRPVVNGKLVIVGSDDGQIYAINRQRGKVAWTKQTQGPVRSSPHIMQDNVFIGSDDGHLYALNIRTGRQRWKTNLFAPIRSTAISQNDLLVIGTEEGIITALNIQTGQTTWRVYTEEAVISRPVLVGRNVIAGSLDRQLYCINRRSGWVSWRKRLAERIYSSLALANEKLVVCTVNGTIYCLDLDDRKEIWKSELNTFVTCSPFITQQGMLYVGGQDGVLYGVETKKGQIVWRFEAGGPIPGSPRVWEPERLVYVGSMDHKLYALPAK